MSEEEPLTPPSEEQLLDNIRVSLGVSRDSFRGVPRPDLNGLRIRTPGNPGIWLVDRGHKRLIPNLETYFTLFRNNSGEVSVLDIDSISDGRPISNGALLAKANNSATIYLVDAGVKRGIASLAIFDRYHFNGGRVVVVPPILLDFIPTGDGISS